MRQHLRGQSFIALWGKFLVLYGEGQWSLVDASSDGCIADNAVYIRLDPHLHALAAGFAFKSPAIAAGQMDLFPVQAVVSANTDVPIAEIAVESCVSASRRRKSA
jgi:hypothetical protein